MKEDQILNRQIRELIAEGTAKAIHFALVKFLAKNKIEASVEQTEKAMLMITAEYGGDKASYPFEEQSLKSELDDIVNEHFVAIEILFHDGKFSEIKKLLGFLVVGQTLEFLNPKLNLVRQMIDRIRDQDLANR